MEKLTVYVPKTIKEYLRSRECSMSEWVRFAIELAIALEPSSKPYPEKIRLLLTYLDIMKNGVSNPMSLKKIISILY